MPLLIPTRKSVAQSLINYFLTFVPEWDPSTQRRSFIGGLITSLGSGLHDWYVALKRYAETEPFPQTATGDFLLHGWWSNITHLSQNPASPALGIAVFQGVAGAAVPANTPLTANGLTYYVRDGVSITMQSQRIISLTFANGIATATTLQPHNFATGMALNVSGASQAQYNVSGVQIIVTSDTTFTYPLQGTPTSPDPSGAILASAAYAIATVVCSTVGSAGNLSGGSSLALALNNVNSPALVTFDGLSGGTDAESTEAFRQRLLNALGTDLGSFTGADGFGGGGEIQTVAQQIPGTTRIWVRRAQLNPPPGYPAEGQVFVAFMRDNDVSPFPSSLQVAAMQAWLAQQIMPAHTAVQDVVVNSPTPQPINFTFSAIVPDTPTMRAAIQASLAQFFVEGINYGANVLQDDYRCAIRDTYDPQTRARLTSFVLAGPTGDQTVASQSLPTLGSVTFP